MELRHLITFLAVSDTGSMTNASARCHLSQGAISQHIKALEEELGTPLFSRKSKEILLTDSGKILLKRARTLVKEAQEAKDEIEELRGGELCGELHVGVESFIEPYIRFAAIDFMKRYPKVILHVQFDRAQALNKMLRDGELDIAFTINTAYHYEGIESKACIPFQLSAIMSKQHWLAERERVSFDDLMQCMVIMPDMGERITNTFQKYTKHDLSRLPVVAIVSSASAALMVLDELNYVTLLPPYYTITSQKLVAKKIEGLDTNIMSHAHWLKNTPLKRSAKAFMEIINQYATPLTQPQRQI